MWTMLVIMELNRTFKTLSNNLDCSSLFRILILFELTFTCGIDKINIFIYEFLVKIKLKKYIINSEVQI